MRTLVDLRFVHEAEGAELRFTCDDCAHFDPSAAVCAHGYPVAPHRPSEVVIGTVVIFCKEFELGAAGDA